MDRASSGGLGGGALDARNHRTMRHQSHQKNAGRLVGRSWCWCGLLHRRLRCREARRDDLRGTRGLRATTGGSRTATRICCDLSHRLAADTHSLLAADIHSLLAAVARLLNATVVVLMAAVVTVVAALVATVPGLGIRSAENERERRGEHTQGQ